MRFRLTPTGRAGSPSLGRLTCGLLVVVPAAQRLQIHRAVIVAALDVVAVGSVLVAPGAEAVDCLAPMPRAREDSDTAAGPVSGQARAAVARRPARPRCSPTHRVTGTLGPHHVTARLRSTSDVRSITSAEARSVPSATICSIAQRSTCSIRPAFVRAAKSRLARGAAIRFGTKGIAARVARRGSAICASDESRAARCRVYIEGLRDMKCLSYVWAVGGRP